MSLYINPSTESKEDFLRREGTVIPRITKLPEGRILVVLLDRGAFTAASIPEGKRDVDDINSPSNKGRRTYYSVPKDKVLEVLSRRDQERLDQIRL